MLVVHLEDVFVSLMKSNMNKILLMIFGSIFVLIGCSKEGCIDAQIISVDIDHVEPLVLMDDKDVNYIYLESSIPAFSRDVRKILYVNDTIIRYGQDKVSAFDGQGKYLFDYSNIGEGPQEFIRLNTVFIQDNKLNLYDGNSRKILRYTTSGEFVEYILCKPNTKGVSPAHIIPFPGTNNYVVLPTFIGVPNVENPLFALYDESLEAIKFSKDIKMHPHINAYSPLVQTDSGILYNDSYSYDVFYVDESLVPKLKYSIDFGKYSIPKSLKEKGVEEISKALINGNEELKYKSIGIRYLNDTPTHLIFGCNGRGLYMVSFDKQKKETKIFSPDITPGLRWTGYLSVHGDKVTIVAESNEKYDQNFVLITFPLSKLI